MANKELTSSCDPLDSIEEHFKLEAGPGSGKTTFIAKHVKRVLLESRRLHKTRKVACITYTNTGVKALQERLGDARHEVEVSTIHSFLYKHVLKPYFWLLDEWPFRENYIPNLVRQRLNGRQIIDVLKNTGEAYLVFQNKIPLHDVVEAFESIKWIRKEGEYKFEFYPNSNRRLGGGDTDESKDLVGKEGWIKNESAEQYREKCHEEEILLYEDVIYYSYILLKEQPKLQEIIRAKFPYLFVDEFQDTTSLQTDILKLLGQKEMIIGVIGDRAQSIYKFTGANVEDFNNWNLPNMKRYYITQNRRTHSAIVDVLNYFKVNDNHFIQKPIRSNLADNRPLIIPGTLQEAFHYCNKKWGKKISVLGYNFEMTVENYDPKIKTDFFKDFLLFLSDDNKRGRKIRGTLKAILAMEQLDYPLAIEEIKRIQKRDGHVSEVQTLKYIEKVRGTYKQYFYKPIIEYYSEVLHKQKLIRAPALRKKSVPAKKYTEVSLKNALSSIKTEKREYQNVQTIHSMKGDEADNVLVAIPENQTNFLIEPDLTKEFHRVYFVAASRAKENLAFQVNPNYIEKIKKHDDEKLFNIIDSI